MPRRRPAHLPERTARWGTGQTRRSALGVLGGACVVVTVSGASLVTPAASAPAAPTTAEAVAAVWRAGGQAALAAPGGSSGAQVQADAAPEVLLAERDGGGASRSEDRLAVSGPEQPAAPTDDGAGDQGGGLAGEQGLPLEGDPVAQAQQQVAALAVQQVADDTDVDAAADASRASAATARAAVVAAEQQRAAEAAAAALAAAQADPRSVAAGLVAEHGWGAEQFRCLDSLWTKESGWRYDADNPTSSAYGIPQALPGAKMASHGDDWQTDPVTQISWGLDYIAGSYGTPCSAWAHSRAVDWY